MVNKENYEEYMLLYADGELSDAETKALLAFVDAHPYLRSELEAYKATRLMPDTNIVYTHKAQLMKASGGGRTIDLGKWWMYAAAACIILFAIMVIQNNNTINTDSTSVAIKKEPKTITQPVIIAPKEIHSTPVSPVSHENTIARQQQKQKVSSKKQIPNFIVPTLQNIEIAKKEEPKISETQAIKVIEPDAPVIVKSESITSSPATVQSTPAKETAILQEDEYETKTPLSWLPINKDKKEGLAVIAEVVNEKIEKVKEVKNSLKDTDVHFRIGNKELFIVRL